MSHGIETPGPVNRRTFLAAIPAAIAAAPLLRGAEAPKLAIDGGTPVRSTHLGGFGYPGARLYDEKEPAEVLEAFQTKTLFRYYGPGKPNRVENFEKEFKTFLGAKYVLAVTSGTAALHVALIALGVGPGDEVILPAWAWHSCYTTIVLTGALPVFAEVDESLALDPADVEAKITPHTKVVMVLQPEGVPADMDRIMAVARKHGIKVLEDVAQSCGAQYKGKRCGTIGDIGIFSFQIHKLISAGEGGAVATNDPLLYERACRFQDLGLLREIHETALGRPYDEKAAIPSFPGTNYRMNEMTGGVMRAQLRKLEGLISQLRHNGRFVTQGLRNLPGMKLRVSNDPDGELGWTVGILLPNAKIRARFVNAVEAENVPVGSPSSMEVLPPLPYVANKAVPHPAWPSFNSPRGKAIRYGAECCPRSMDIFHRTVKVTISRLWTDNDLKDMVAAITKVHNALLV